MGRGHFFWWRHQPSHRKLADGRDHVSELWLLPTQRMSSVHWTRWTSFSPMCATALPLPRQFLLPDVIRVRRIIATPANQLRTWVRRQATTGVNTPPWSDLYEQSGAPQKSMKWIGFIRSPKACCRSLIPVRRL